MIYGTLPLEERLVDLPLETKLVVRLRKRIDLPLERRMVDLPLELRTANSE
jgi:hypothetical protein